MLSMEMIMVQLWVVVVMEEEEVGVWVELHFDMVLEEEQLLVVVVAQETVVVVEVLVEEVVPSLVEVVVE